MTRIRYVILFSKMGCVTVGRFDFTLTLEFLLLVRAWVVGVIVVTVGGV